jgi:hypothetical protein
LCRLQAEAVSLSVTGDHESQWYCSVQWPLLQTAFRNLPAIEPKQMYAPPVFHVLSSVLTFPSDRTPFR